MGIIRQDLMQSLIPIMLMQSEYSPLLMKYWFPISRSPPCRTGSCSGRRTCQSSHSCTHKNDPGSSSPRRR
ncbi:hypothetical protein F7725_002411 [Dissostichus mawsoni]|uniref:Uncharacterized protein n=1 Tax=Dissostichus mawsoni TaxID=36200 RepID=A0A7J5Y2A6_DISMA|nr:hypothetical protein F7725_002411 [Dissostichus mawsoni]